MYKYNKGSGFWVQRSKVNVKSDRCPLVTG